MKPFTLICAYCESVTYSLRAAIAAGWSDIGEDDAWSWTHTGLCPECGGGLFDGIGGGQ